MRNLQLLTSCRVSGLQELKSPQAISVDYDTGNIYFVTKTHIVLVDPNNSSVIDLVCLSEGEEEYLPADGSGGVVGAEHLANQQSLCVAIATGNIILWSYILQQVECVGGVQDGLRTMQWSPDQEVVAFITGRDTLLLMTREFEPITETPLNPTGFGEAAFVNVGWGKKETQFHGSAGKTAAKETVKAVSPALAWDDRRPRLSWRGDGQFFVVSSVCPTSGSRQLRVWNRECVLQSTSEQTDGVEQPLAWKPSGSSIATAQQSPNKHSIIFYEKNGLRHGEFTLPVTKDSLKVCEVMWNLDSSILTVWCEDLPPEGATADYNPRSYIQLWTMGNHHWYLKQNLHFKATQEDRIVSVLWDLEHAYRLHIVTFGGEYMQYTWSWATNQSWGESCDDQASVAVIDGDKVSITPMRNMVVPPPLSAYQLQLPCAVNQVLFAPPPFTNDMAAVLVDGRIAVYRLKSGDNVLDEGDKSSAAGGPGFSVCCDVLKLDHIYSIKELPANVAVYPMALTHFSWVMPHCLLFCGTTAGGPSVLYQAEFTADKDHHLTVSSSIEVEGRVLTTAPAPSGETVAIQLTDGSLLRYHAASGSLLPWETAAGDELRFPQPCTQMRLSEIGGQDVVLGLTETFRFYVNNMELASNCTSFAVHDEFLLLTTLTHTCRCISRSTPLQALSRLSDEKAHPFDESVRRVERGSRIVTVVPGDTKLVLQMPRGNLETVHPRALVLTAVRRALDRLEYRTAFSLMRKHRINMNLIYDHNPQMFLNNVQKFLSQISSVTHINIFLTELQEEDSTLTMYTAEYSGQSSCGQSSRTANQPCKIDTVCDAVRSAMKAMDENKYLLSILTTYVKKTSPELEAALQLISDLKGQEKTNDRVSAEEALRYLLFLVDVNELYDVALGSYDFDLVMMVAEKSQKDPKEYLPFLGNLRRLEENYQRYTIDRHLKRYRKALQHIANCPDQFNECLTLINDQKLYREALEIFPRQSQQYKTIAGLFGEHLLEKKKYEEAGLVFMKAESWAQALQAFEKSLNWRQALCMAAMLDYSAENLRDLSLRLAKTLKVKQETSSAATLFEQYVGDIEEAIIVLIEGQEWEEALRLMYKYKRTDFIETNLQPSLSERYGQQVATLESLKTDFEHHSSRLRVVREEKERSQLASFEGDGHADADLFSDASSAAGESVQSSRGTTDSQRSTVISRSTGRSSRYRRKLERKKWSLKEGSEHEDLALLEALSNIVSVVNTLRGEITPLLKVLVQFCQESEAREIQQKYGELLKIIERSLPDIWIQQGNADQTHVIGPEATANKIAEAMQSGQRLKTSSESDSLVKARPTLVTDTKWKLGILET